MSALWAKREKIYCHQSERIRGIGDSDEAAAMCEQSAVSFALSVVVVLLFAVSTFGAGPSLRSKLDVKQQAVRKCADECHADFLQVLCLSRA